MHDVHHRLVRLEDLPHRVASHDEAIEKLRRSNGTLKRNLREMQKWKDKLTLYLQGAAVIGLMLLNAKGEQVSEIVAGLAKLLAGK